MGSDFGLTLQSSKNGRATYRSANQKMSTTPTHSQMRSFYAAIGRFVLTWADVENYLDLFVLMTRKPTDHRLPHQLAGKIKFVGIGFNSNRRPVPQKR